MHDAIAKIIKRVTCETCCFSKPRHANPGTAWCRRVPPQLVVLQKAKQTLKSAFPVVNTTDVCGEWKVQ